MGMVDHPPYLNNTVRYGFHVRPDHCRICAVLPLEGRDWEDTLSHHTPEIVKFSSLKILERGAGIFFQPLDSG